MRCTICRQELNQLNNRTLDKNVGIQITYYCKNCFIFLMEVRLDRKIESYDSEEPTIKLIMSELNKGEYDVNF